MKKLVINIIIALSLFSLMILAVDRYEYCRKVNIRKFLVGNYFSISQGGELVESNEKFDKYRFNSNLWICVDKTNCIIAIYRK